MKHSFGLAFAAVLWAAGSALAQTCTDACSAARCAGRDNCEIAYEECVRNAGGDPDVEAQCLQQRTACLTATDDAYVSCVGGCVNPSDECVYFCAISFGTDYTRCLDQYTVCLMFATPAVCQPIFDACVAAASTSRRRCLLGCATPCPTVPVAPETWGRVKRLYRD